MALKISENWILRTRSSLGETFCKSRTVMRLGERLLQALADSATLWPEAFIKGIAFECFVNEADQLRLKCDHLKVVLKALAGLGENARLAIVEKLAESISGATPKDVYRSRTKFEKTCDELAVIDWRSL